MARFARVVVPGLPHHVTARGNRREPIFFEDGDQDIYADILAEETRRAGVEVWAYCLMPNHVHLVMTPAREDGLGRAVGEAHRRWTAFVNARARWRGHLFDGRFASVVMDETHLLSAVRYISLNPVRAGLTARAADWRWSSVAAHLSGLDDGLATVAPVLALAPDFADLIADDPARDVAFRTLRAAERTGRPLGTRDFVLDLERRLGRRLAVQGRGRRPASAPAGHPSLFEEGRDNLSPNLRDGVDFARCRTPRVSLLPSVLFHPV
jgi:putative transposase